jgi:hypothetical protein
MILSIDRITQVTLPTDAELPMWGAAIPNDADLHMLAALIGSANGTEQRLAQYEVCGEVQDRNSGYVFKTSPSERKRKTIRTTLAEILNIFVVPFMARKREQSRMTSFNEYDAVSVQGNTYYTQWDDNGNPTSVNTLE